VASDEKELLEGIFTELEHMDPDYRKKWRGPFSAWPLSLHRSPKDDDDFPFRNGPQPMNVIAAFHGISKQQMTPLIEGLEKLQMVKREVNPQNRREVIVSVTTEGKKAFKDMKEAALKQWMSKLDRFSEDEVKEIIVHLHAINGFFSASTKRNSRF